MPRPSERTRSRKRMPRRLPGGRTGTQFGHKITARSTCSLCGQPLAGISNVSPKIRKLNRSRRRVRRVLGGQLCHNCVKTTLKQAVRAL